MPNVVFDDTHFFDLSVFEKVVHFVFRQECFPTEAGLVPHLSYLDLGGLLDREAKHSLDVFAGQLAGNTFVDFTNSFRQNVHGEMTALQHRRCNMDKRNVCYITR